MNLTRPAILTVTILTALAHAQQPEAASALLAKSKSAYREMRSDGYTMHAEVWRRVSRGEQWHESRGEYRLSQRDNAMGLDFGSVAQRVQFLRRADGTFVEYSAGRRKYAEYLQDDERPSAALTELERMRVLLYQRLADLADSRPITMAQKREGIKTKDGARRCLKVSIKGDAWSAVLWIEENTGLVWRSEMTARRNGEFTDERVTWTEITTRADAVNAALTWSPPPGSVRVPALDLLPPIR